MVAGPEITIVLLEYEGKISKQGSSDELHEQYQSIQQQFLTDVRGIMQTTKEKGNPFAEEGKE
jgi:hypothetical protein